MLVSFKLWKENTEKEKCLNIFTHQFQTITYHLNELLILLSFMFMYIYLPCQAACIITWLKAHLLTHKLGTHVLLQTKHLKIITAVAVTANLLPMMFKFQLGQSCSCYPKFQTVYLKGKYILSVCKYRAAALSQRMPEFQWGKERDSCTSSICYSVCSNAFLYKMIIHSPEFYLFCRISKATLLALTVIYWGFRNLSELQCTFSRQ